MPGRGMVFGCTTMQSVVSMTNSIDDKLMIVTDQEKIQASDIEGTFYGSQSGASIPRTILTDRLSTSASPTTGTTLNSTLTFNTAPIVFSPQMMFSLYVDSDDTAAALWPSGANLTSANRPRVTWSMNEALTDVRSGRYVYSFSIKNESVGTQTYYLHVRLLIPASTTQAGTTT